LIFFIPLYLFYKIDKDIKPVLSSVSNAEVRMVATQAINQIIKEELSDNVKYSNFISVKTDKNGDIASIEVNTVEMNKFGADVAIKAQEEMKFIGGRGVTIPLGVITGSSLLSYYGPRIKINVIPMGNITTDFKSELQPAGINQTRYRVYITVNTSLQVMIPFGNDIMNVVSTIPIAETLIVGKVPSTYFNNGAGLSTMPSVINIPAAGSN
jgi:sporulation protein YunB